MKPNNTIIDTPYFDESVYLAMPEIIKKSCSIYESKREKDIFLLSLLTTFGAYFPNVTGKYHKKMISPTLFTFIVGPPASGKGVMNNAKIAVKQLDSDFSQKIGLPVKYGHSIIIAGNVSDSEFINKLYASGGVGIFFESEADTIAETFKQDWGGYSDKWRKAAEHETISKLRVSDKTEIVIEQPKLSVCISGTPDQLPKLVPDVSNGLYSRFLYYIYDETSEFKNPGQVGDEIEFISFYSKIGEELLKIKDFIGDTPVEFIISPELLNDLTGFFRQCQEWALLNVGKAFDSVIKRYGVACYRIAMVLSIVRTMESESLLNDTIYCSIQDYQIAKNMIATLLNHSICVYELFTQDNLNTTKKVLIDLFNLLPQGEHLQTSDFDEHWKGRFSSRTAATRRNQLVEMGYLIKIKDGLWYTIILN